MKTRQASLGMYMVVAAIALSVASCGNSQKKKERMREREITAQPIDTVTVIESETMVITVDSVAVDTAALRNNANAPKRTK